ncbi:CaiB/BaiF CoA transferase family protein [Mycolicibacterium sediminis]|uniref:CoA transferase n=1 Tax=Mycolicibacterium sediminis TaxID=1286180 RepID=A0A7I7QRW8_9MYCO|nr:CoA transferase [Mycolicibacterium sediminis]BBY28790.1 CoA transferase [Mycolicibacterium sediminis]
MSSRTGPRPLDGVRVVDLSTTFMGPYSTMLLAHWGADVIKVEAPGGDVLRFIGDHRESGMGPVFLNANQGKRSLAVDLKSSHGRDVVTRLARHADVFVHNSRSAAADRCGFGPREVLEANPRVVYCAFRGFGSGGPYEHRPAYDDVIQAASGFAAVQGLHGDPEYIRSAIADKTVGVMGAAAILAALHGRDATGVGTALEIPMFETLTSFLLLEQQGGWAFDPPVGNPGYARTESPYRRPFKTLDGSMAVMIYTDAQWRKFFVAIGKPELADDPRFRTIRERTINTAFLYQLLDEEMAGRTTAAWEELLGEADIATGPVNTVTDLFEDPHLAATGFFRSIDHPTEGPLRLPRQPAEMGAPDPRSGIAPLYGEHTVAVLREIGVSEDGIAEMLDARSTHQTGMVREATP